MCNLDFEQNVEFLSEMFLLQKHVLKKGLSFLSQICKLSSRLVKDECMIFVDLAAAQLVCNF